MKDPAVLFYYQDFLVGTEFMTDEEIGKYIRILCHQADKGRLSKQQVLSICKASAISKSIQEKLKIDNDGFYYNERMEMEKEKRRKFAESRRNNAKGGKASAEHMEDINEDINKNKKGERTAFFLKAFTDEFQKNKEFITEWKDWVTLNDQRFTELTAMTAKKQINHLMSLPIKEATKLLNQAITNNWRGIKYNSNINEKTEPEKSFKTSKEMQDLLDAARQRKTVN